MRNPLEDLARHAQAEANRHADACGVSEADKAYIGLNDPSPIILALGDFALALEEVAEIITDAMRPAGKDEPS